MSSPCDESWVELEEASGYTDVTFLVKVNKTGSSAVTLTQREGRHKCSEQEMTGEMGK